MKVTNEIKPVEIDGIDTTVGEKRLLTVESHWNYETLIHLNFGSMRILVRKAELEKAIKNATNHL